MMENLSMLKVTHVDYHEYFVQIMVNEQDLAD